MKVINFLALFLAFVSIILSGACKAKANLPDSGLPRDILGISVGMNKTAAENRLKEIAKMIRVEEKRQEVWVLKENKNYSHLAIGYDREERVRYVTAMAKPKDGTPVKPSEIGNVDAAEKQVTGSNYRYTWQVAAQDDIPPYTILVQGNQPDSLSLYTLSATKDETQSGEDEEEERREKENKNESNDKK